MKKFKKIMLGALSVLTLGLFVATGAKVKAGEVTRTYDFYNTVKGTDDTVNLVANGSDEDFELTSAEDSTDKMTVNVANSNSGGQFRWVTTPAIEIQRNKTTYNAVITFTFTTKGDANITAEFDSGGTNASKKTWNTSIDGVASTGILNGTGVNNTNVFSFDITGKAEHTFAISQTSGDNSNLKIKSFVITDTYNTSTPEQQAVDAISAIPSEITYTDECKALIDAATTKVNAVEESKRNSTNISNYATYTSAVSTFNGLESAAISAFAEAVTSIGTVTTSSGSAISTAEAAYDALLASTKENADVISAKADLDTAIAAYNLAVYDSYSKSYVVPADTVYEKDKDNKSVAVTYTEKTQLGNSIFYATNGMAYKDEAALTIGDTSWDDRLYTGGSSTCNSTKQERVVTFETKTRGTLKIAASSQKNTDSGRTVDLYNGSFTKTSQSAQIADSNNTYMYFDIPSAGTYYLGSSGNGGVNFFYLEFMPETSYTANDVDLTFDTQYNEEEAADSTKLRFIGTIDGIAYKDYDKIDSIKFTFVFKETARTAQVHNLYKSIVSGSTTVKAAADNKMYVIYQLNNINKTAYQGEKLSDCKFIITFTDGSTVSVNRADITLPTAFTTVVA